MKLQSVDSILARMEALQSAARGEKSASPAALGGGADEVMLGILSKIMGIAKRPAK